MAKRPNKKRDDAERKRKSEAATVALRVEEVLRIRIDGAQFHDIVQYAAEKGWGLQERMIRNYIRRADALMVARIEKSRRKLLARHLTQRQTLYARAVNAADYGTALRVLADEADLRGLYPPKKQDLKLNHKGLPEQPKKPVDLSQMTDEELRNLGGLLAKATVSKKE